MKNKGSTYDDLFSDGHPETNQIAGAEVACTTQSDVVQTAQLGVPLNKL
jgi:hypothetical protein